MLVACRLFSILKHHCSVVYHLLLFILPLKVFIILFVILSKIPQEQCHHHNSLLSVFWRHHKLFSSFFDTPGN